jgi:hypothetical protein
MDDFTSNGGDEHDETLNFHPAPNKEFLDSAPVKLEGPNLLPIDDGNSTNQVSAQEETDDLNLVQYADEPNFKKSISNPKLKLDMVRVS